MKLNHINLCIFALSVVVTTQAQDFSSFRVISQRNIFNQNRTARNREGTPIIRTSTVGLEGFSLVGTLCYETNQIAFFDGNRAEYHKALHPAETIAGYKLVSVLPDSVQLESDGKTVVMKIGTRLQRSSGTGSVEAATTTNTVAAADTMSVPAVETSVPASDVLKKLMQRREQETK